MSRAGRGLAGRPPGLRAGRYAMLLVEQGVLWVLPMLWLVLLLSEEAGAATATTGSRLLGGPGGRGGGQGPGQGPGQGSPLPQRRCGAPPGGQRGPEHSCGAWDTHVCASRCTRVQR